MDAPKGQLSTWSGPQGQGSLPECGLDRPESPGVRSVIVEVEDHRISLLDATLEEVFLIPDVRLRGNARLYFENSLSIDEDYRVPFAWVFREQTQVPD